MAAEVPHAQVDVVVGGHWGDEGKGKKMDELSERADIGVKYSGADNAGHRVVNDKGEFKMRLTPVSVFNPDAISVIGSKVAINPTVFLEELDMLHSKGVDTNIVVDFRSPLILPWHRERDGLQEAARGANALGTTKRGVGPAMSDSIGRVGLRVADLLSGDFDDKLLASYNDNLRLTRLMDNEQLLSELVIPRLSSGAVDEEKLAAMIEGAKAKQYYDFDKVREDLLKARDVIGPYVGNTFQVLHEGYDEGKHILGEGSQGVLLDITYGSYPFVTSSHPAVDGFLNATRLPKVDRVIGVTKAYITRVGEGPMPTQMDRETDDYIRDRGQEFGTNTGRDRRCGWFDAPLTRYAIRAGGITEVVMNKLDIFDGMQRIGICTGYEINGRRVDRIYDASAELLQHAKPIYEYMPGWKEDTTGVRRFEDLPANARQYVQRVEQLIESPITSIGVGPARDAVIQRT